MTDNLSHDLVTCNHCAKHYVTAPEILRCPHCGKEDVHDEAPRVARLGNGGMSVWRVIGNIVSIVFLVFLIRLGFVIYDALHYMSALK
jgi:hypothetical protein